MCDGDKEAFSKGEHSLEDMSDEKLKNLIVDDNHGIIYCYIPKVIYTWTRSTLRDARSLSELGGAERNSVYILTSSYMLDDLCLIVINNNWRRETWTPT